MGIKTTVQIARENSVHPLLVGQWKTTLRERMHELFERGNQAPEDSDATASNHRPTDRRSGLVEKKSRQLGLLLRDES